MLLRCSSWTVSIFLLALLRPSCAWSLSGNGDAPKAGAAAGRVALLDRPAEATPALFRKMAQGIVHLLDEMVEESIAGRQAPPAPTAPAQLPTCRISNDLARRQDNGQIGQLSGSIGQLSGSIQQLSGSIRQVSAASQQVSQQSQQLSQSLQQATNSLNQLRGSVTQLSSASQSASQAAQQAQQSAQQASQAADRADSSASSAISSAQASAASSASAAIAANLASVTSNAGQSASSIMAAASSSAAGVMASASSMIESVQAQATAVRDQANTDITQAQGTAVSVTQAAVAIVGAIVGSSLLTILAFWLVLRRKRIRDRRSRALLQDGGPGRNSMQDANGYFAQEKETRPPSNGSSVYNVPKPRRSSTIPAPAATMTAQAGASTATTSATAPSAYSGAAPGPVISTGPKIGAAPRMASAMAPPVRRQVATEVPDTQRNLVILQPVPTIRPGAARVARLSTVESAPADGSPAPSSGPGGLENWLKQGREKGSPFGTLKRESQRLDVGGKKVSWPLVPGTMAAGNGAGPS